MLRLAENARDSRSCSLAFFALRVSSKAAQRRTEKVRFAAHQSKSKGVSCEQQTQDEAQEKRFDHCHPAAGAASPRTCDREPGCWQALLFVDSASS